MTALTGFISEHLLIVIIAAVIILIIAAAFVLPFIFKLAGLRRKSRETAAVKKDLMIWRRISGLARGGSEAAGAKREFEKTKIALLRASFGKGLLMLKSSRTGRYGVPWYISVGEPSSGKSLLMSCSDVDMIPSENETPSTDGSGSVPARFWLGRQAVVLDVSGRAFFDRWFGGDSAEWSEIIRLIKSSRKKKPVSGIILTVPADALIADNEELCKKKATLIAAELHRLVRDLSVYLPCYVVVTKMDVVTGFRDYFSFAEEKMRRQIFGWDNPEPAFGYDKSVFSVFWESTLSSLRQGRNGLLLASSSPASGESSGKCTDRCGVFMFPEAFDGLFPSLDRYLKTIFGMRKMRGLENLALSGVYFTSGRDEGITFNKDFAGLCGKSVDEAPMTIGEASAKSFFVTDLLVHRIFPETWDYGYTGAAVIKRRLPYYAVSAFFVCLAVFWGAYAAVFYGNASFVPVQETAYYDDLSSLFAGGVIGSSPLLSSGVNGEGILLFDEPMDDGSGVRRIDFFSAAHSNIGKKFKLPIGFAASALMMDGRVDIAYADRQYLLNRIQTSMAFMPLVAAVEKNFILTEKQPVTPEKRVAISELLDIAFFREKVGYDAFEKNILYHKGTADAFLAYMFPEMPSEARSILETFNPRHDRDAILTNEEIISDPAYTAGSAAGIRSIINGWRELSNYPESVYALQRSLSAKASVMDGLLREYEALASSMKSGDGTTLLKEQVDSWRKLGGKLLSAGDDITYFLGMVNAYYSSAPASGIEELFHAAYLSYVGLMESDFGLLEDFSRRVLESDGKYDKSVVKLETSYLSGVKSEVSGKLEKEYASLKKGGYFPGNNHLFTKVSGKATASPDEGGKTQEADGIMNYEIVCDMVSMSLLPAPGQDMKSPADFAKLWNANKEAAVSRSGELEDYSAKFADSRFTSALAPLMKEMLKNQDDYNRITLVSEALELYPPSPTGLIAAVARMDTPSGMQDILVSGNAGDNRDLFDFRPEYNPAAAGAYIKPFGQIRLCLSEKDKDGSMSYVSAFFEGDDRYQETLRIMDDYGVNFVRYWGSYGDSLKPFFEDYASFHIFASAAKPYAVNNRLYSAYDLSASLLTGIGNGVLTAGAEQDRVSALEAIGSRKKALDMQFAGECSRLLEAWASLPSSPSEAYREITGMPENALRSRFLTVSGGTDGMTAIPWWDKLISEGIRLMKAGASEEAVKAVTRYRSLFSRFPLLSDGEAYDTLSVEELKSLAGALEGFGWKAGGESSDGDNGSDRKDAKVAEIMEPIRLKGIIRNEKDVKKWGAEMLKILNALVGEPKPLQWTLVIPDDDAQTKLASSYMGAMPASARFRYFDISYSSLKNTSRFPTTAGQGKEIAPVKGDASAWDMIFNFYTHSDSPVPDAVVSVQGGWAPVRLYLNGECADDKENGISYAPLVLRDGMGVEYVFFIGLKFSKELPDRDVWPSSGNWPEFPYIPAKYGKDSSGTAVKYKIFKSESFFAGY